MTLKKYKIEDSVINRLVSLFLLSSISFFLPLGDAIEKGLSYLFFLMLFLTYIYKQNFKISRYGIIYILFLIIVINSIIPAKIYWGQSFIVSLISILPFIIYGFFIIINGLGIDKQKLTKIVDTIGKIYIVLYLLKYLYPSIFPFGQIVIDSVRGERLVMSGDFFSVFLFFHSLINVIKRPNKKDLFWLILSMLVIILPLTRQRIALAIILAFVMVVKYAQRKVILYCIPLFILSGGILMRSDSFSEFSKMTSEQMESENPYDRIREIGLIYYFTNFPKKGLNQIIGNGVPSYGRSAYGNMSKEFADSTKIYLIDIGIAGIYNYFGLLGLLCYIFMIMFLVFDKRIVPKYHWCKYMLVFILGSSILSGVPLIPSQFIFIPVCSYLLIPCNNRH